MLTTDQQELATRNIALFRRWLDAGSSRDFNAKLDICHPDISIELPWTIDPFPKIVRGLDNIIAFAKSIPEFTRVHNFVDIQIHAFADDPNELYAEYKGDMVLVDGREYKNDYLARATIKDGKLFIFKEWPDPIRLLEAMGGSVNLPTDFGARIVTSSTAVQPSR